MQGKRILGSQPVGPCCQAVSPHPAPLTSEHWLLWMNEGQQAEGRGMALLRAQACHLEPSSPAPRWGFREPCRCSLCGAEVPLWMCDCPEPGSWLAPCFLPKLFRLLPASLSRLSVLLGSQFVFIPNLPPVLTVFFDSPHTHWNGQCILLPFAVCRDPPKVRCQLLQRRDFGGRMQAMPSSMAWLFRTSCGLS